MLVAFVCEGLDAEEAGVPEVRSPIEPVAVCEKRPPGVEVVLAPVALATGTSTEPAVTVVVDVASEFPSATLPHINMTAGIPGAPESKQLSRTKTLDVSGMAHDWSLYSCSVALPLPVRHVGRRSGTTPRAPEVTRQVSSGRETVGFTGLFSSQIMSRN